MKRLLIWSLSLLFTMGGVAASANASGEGSTVLTIVNLHKTDKTFIELDMAALKQLPSYDIDTHNPWEEGVHRYTGFNPNDLLTQYDLQGEVLRLMAFNQYITEVPLEDFTELGAIIAYEMDGAPMSVRNKGPLMVIYDFNEHPELKNEAFYGRSIWQLYKLEVMRVSR